MCLHQPPFLDDQAVLKKDAELPVHNRNPQRELFKVFSGNGQQLEIFQGINGINGRHAMKKTVHVGCPSAFGRELADVLLAFFINVVDFQQPIGHKRQVLEKNVVCHDLLNP